MKTFQVGFCQILLCFVAFYSRFKVLSERSGHRSWTRRFALPPKTVLKIVPHLTIPTYGTEDGPISSKVELSMQLIIELDKLGWNNVFDTFPFAPSSGISLLRRGKRDVWRQPWGNYSGENLVQYRREDREHVLSWIIGRINKIGLDGRACLLRAACEIHDDSLQGYGLVGEMIILLFSVSKSRDGGETSSQLKKDFIKAERMGKRGRCEGYRRECKISILEQHYFYQV